MEKKGLCKCGEMDCWKNGRAGHYVPGNNTDRQTGGQEEHMTEQGGYTCTPEVNPIITYEYLSSLSPLPCQPRRDAFRAAFPEGTTLENALAWASNDDLIWIVRYASPAMGDKAYAELLRREVSDYCLRDIVCSASPEMGDKAYAELLRREVSNDCLHYIVCYASPAMCDKAAAELLRRKAADDCLRWIVCYARPAMRDKARAELSRRGA